MLKESEQDTKAPLDFNFEHVYNEERDKLKNKIKKEKDMKADDLVVILEKYLKEKGFLTVKEKNYLGYNNAPFDLTVGDKRCLKIYGFEIKSDKDSFDRLQRQLQHYSFICEEVYIVVHKKEIPKWLPDWCGVIRISSKGEIYQESYASHREPFEISTGYAWDRIAQGNNIAGSKDKLQKIFDEIIGIRKNILFNHYFAIEFDSTTNGSTFKKFFPLTDQQKRFIMGLNIEYQMKELNRELKGLEKRFTIIKQLVNIGQSKITQSSSNTQQESKK